MHFLIITTQPPAVFPPPADDPFPVQTSNAQMFATIPGQRVRPSLLYVGEGYVTAITNDVNDQSVGYLPLDLRNVQEMFRSAVRPTLNPLTPRNCFHCHAKKVPAGPAIRDDLCLYGKRI